MPRWLTILLIVLVAALLALDGKTLLRADFLLLLTFVAFFVFAGNLARIGAVDRLLRALLAGREYLVSLLASQVISNVPAALLLSGFTENARALLLGVNIGGTGTLIASLASLITFREYVRHNPNRKRYYLGVFSAFNFSFLAVLLVFSSLVG